MGMNCKIIISIIAFTLPTLLCSQNSSFDWAVTNEQLNGTYNSADQAVIDSEGNIVSASIFTGTVDFDPSSAIQKDSSFYSVAIQKFDTYGNLIWHTTIDTANGQPYSINLKAITTDANNNIYITGIWKGTIDFDPGPGRQIRQTGFYQTFVLKLNSNGQYVDVVSTNHNSGIAGVCRVFAIEYHQDGSVVLGGSFDGTIDFNPRIAQNILTNSGNKHNSFILKLDTLLNYQWVYSIDSAYYSRGAVDISIGTQGEIYCLGQFLGEVDFDFSTSTQTLHSNRSDPSNYLLKLNSSGQFMWAIQIRDTLMGGVDARNITHEVGNKLYCSGLFEGSPTINSVNTSFGLSSLGDIDVFVMQINSSGQVNWVKQYGGTNSQGSTDIAIDKYKNVYTVGFFEDHIDLDPGSSSVNYIANGSDAYLQKLDSNGNYLWSNVFSGADVEYVKSVFVDKCGQLAISGLFSSNANIQSGLVLSSALNTTQAFFAFKNGLSDSIAIHVMACDSFMLDPSSNIYYTSGQYTEVLSNNSGCDSIVILDLEIQEAFNQIDSIFSCKSFYWNVTDSVYNNSGKYYEHFTSKDGCDSIHILDLIVQSDDTTFLDKASCEEFFWDASNTNYLSSGTYHTTLKSSHGCDSILELNLTIVPRTGTILDTVCDDFVPPIFIPNAFTPNQDGVNNQFEFYGFPEPVKLTVFDRWGNIVFSSPNYQNNWDGTFNGKTLPLGSYTYLIEYIYVNPQSNNINVNGSKRNLRGIINIIP